MKVSFYRNLTWLIGILVAVEILLKVGLHNGMLMLVADLAVVLVLTFLFHRMRVSGYDDAAERIAADESVREVKHESEWQKKHDQWWQKHRQLETNATPNQPPRHQPRSSRPVTPGSTVNLSQLERTNRQLKSRINHLNSKISVLQNDRNHSTSYRNTDWYQQIVKMKQQIARLKSEYK